MPVLCAFADQDRPQALRFDDGSYLAVPDGYEVFYGTTPTVSRPHYRFVPVPQGAAASRHRVGALADNCERPQVEKLFAYLRGEPVSKPS
jgi:hypothetical protein